MFSLLRRNSSSFTALHLSSDLSLSFIFSIWIGDQKKLWIYDFELFIKGWNINVCPTCVKVSCDEDCGFNMRGTRLSHEANLYPAYLLLQRRALSANMKSICMKGTFCRTKQTWAVAVVCCQTLYIRSVFMLLCVHPVPDLWSTFNLQLNRLVEHSLSS